MRHEQFQQVDCNSQVPHLGDRSLQSEIQIEPWQAAALSREQSKAATLLAAIEVLQSVSRDDTEAGVALPPLPALDHTCCWGWPGELQGLCAMMSISKRRDTER